MGMTWLNDDNDAFVDRSFEWRKIDLSQCSFGDFGSVVVTTRLSGAIADPVFSAGENSVRRAVVRSLKATHASSRHERSEVGIFARAFDNAAPTRVARDVDHGCKRPMHACGPGFGGGNAR